MTTIKNLLLAMLNATLILVALCLYLGLLVMQTAERAADRFADAAGNIAPLRSEVTEVGESVAGLRREIKLLAEAPGALSENAEAALELRVNAIGQRLDDLQLSLDDLAQMPTRVVETAIDQGADRAADAINQFRSCTPDGEA